ncbi:MAG: pro-sigmaK processing inhibitor BofA family protein [Clostridia bacterium]
MLPKLTCIMGFTALMAVVYFFSMRATPRKGFMCVLERVCAGVILLYLCSVLLEPLGVPVVQGPVWAVTAGFLGVPGVALMVFSQMKP